MTFDTKLGGKSSGARVAGLGIVAAVALTIGGTPAIARAEESTDVSGEASLVTVAVDVDGPVVASDGQTTAAGQANVSSTADETLTVAPVAQPVAEPETTTPITNDATEGLSQPSVGIQNSAAVSTNEADGQSQSGNVTQVLAQSNDADANASNTGVAVTDEAEPAAADITGVAATLQATTPISSAAEEEKTVEQATTQVVSEATNQVVAAPSRETKAVTTTQAASSGSSDTTLVNVYRLYNPNSGEHFYTTSLEEAKSVFSAGWRWEDAVYLESSSTGAPVYRVYNPNAGAHFYTVSSGERDHLVSLGWRYEGVSWKASGSNLLYRLYNPNSPIGEHLYTASAAERDNVIKAGWNDEGTAWAYVPGFREIAGSWVVSSAYGSQERYWIASNAQLAKNRYIETSEGSGYRAYAKSDGAVVRGSAHVGSGVMFANNDGKLYTVPSTKGWWVTSSITGDLQRYYIDSVTTDASGNGVMGAKTGWFTVGGTQYYGYYSLGYVARNTIIGKSASAIYSADNDGKLTTINDYRSTGWKYANSVGSSTGWFLSNSLSNFRVMIFHKLSSNDPWMLDKDYLCGYGANTFTGFFTLLGRFAKKDNGYEYVKWNTYYAVDPTAGFDTRYQMYHGVLYYSATGAVSELGLGEKISGGCIRLEDANAKYIYDNVPNGTSMYTYY